ncbi:MAG: CBS domain-containing protein [Saprospiraceae bacterium]|jgi:CBS domain-containing protein|nr:CBS domain-containing protein [Saprospiraceae bacterium]
MMNESVETIMITDLITLGPESTVEEVSDIFKSKNIHHIPVIDKGILIGMVTTFDMWKIKSTTDEYSKILVKTIMTKKLAKLEPDDKIGTAAELFLVNRFHAIPVVKDGLLVGLVTTFDILRYGFRKEYPDPILFKDVLDKGLDAAHH